MFGVSRWVFTRTRWVGVGVVIAIAAGAGGLLIASASSSSGASSFVPVTPCRLLDTRPASIVGARSTPVGSAETFTTAAWGVNGNCSIPTGATALSMNVVAINATSASYLTVFPAGRPLPLSSSLNWVAGAPPTPNAVTVPLSADGRLSFYNNSGSVDLAVDIVGYYELTGGGPAALAAPRPTHVIEVAKSGGDFTSVRAALASITDNGLFSPYLIRIAPGVYIESGGIDLKDYVDIEGSGRDTTTLLCGDCGSETVPIVDGSSAVMRASVGTLHSEVRNLTVSIVAGGATYNTAIWIGNVAGGVTLDHVGATSVAAAPGYYAYGVAVLSAQVTMEGLTVSVTGTGATTGIFSAGSTAYAVIRDSSVRGGTSILLVASGHAAVYDSVLNGATLGLGGHCFNVVDISLAPYSCT